ncbi:hypothetical protein C8R45DRAFT_1218398, partial [Mycena sanguinolenta]
MCVAGAWVFGHECLFSQLYSAPLSTSGVTVVPPLSLLSSSSSSGSASVTAPASITSGDTGSGSAAHRPRLRPEVALRAGIF